MMQNPYSNQGIYDKTTSPFKEADELIQIIKKRYEKVALDFPIALDIGCGTGYITELLWKELKIKKMYAIDANDAMIQCAKMQYKMQHRNDEVEFFEEDFSKDLSELQYTKSLVGKCSLIFSNDLLGNISDKNLVISNIDKVAAKHADIYLLFYCPPPLKSGWISKLFNSLSPHNEFLDWKQRFTKIGFRTVDSKIIECVEIVDHSNFQMNIIPMITNQIRKRFTYWPEILTNLFLSHLTDIQAMVYKSNGQTTYKFPRQKFYFRLTK